MPKIVKGAVLVSAALMLSGCGSALQSEVSRMSYSTANHIAAGLEDGGFSCGPWSDKQGAVGPVTSGTCQHNAITISISTFSSAKVMKSLLPSLGAEGCYVEGDTWIISPSDSAPATCADIHTVVGGEVK